MWHWLAHDLRLYRMRRGPSGNDLAKLFNVARSSVSRYENNVAQ